MVSILERYDRIANRWCVGVPRSHHEMPICFRMKSRPGHHSRSLRIGGTILKHSSLNFVSYNRNISLHSTLKHTQSRASKNTTVSWIMMATKICTAFPFPISHGEGLQPAGRVPWRWVMAAPRWQRVAAAATMWQPTVTQTKTTMKTTTTTTSSFRRHRREWRRRPVESRRRRMR
jgi:hypothetical protein